MMCQKLFEVGIQPFISHQKNCGRNLGFVFTYQFLHNVALMLMENWPFQYGALWGLTWAILKWPCEEIQFLALPYRFHFSAPQVPTREKTLCYVGNILGEGGGGGWVDGPLRPLWPCPCLWGARKKKAWLLGNNIFYFFSSFIHYLENKTHWINTNLESDRFFAGFFTATRGYSYGALSGLAEGFTSRNPP